MPINNSEELFTQQLGEMLNAENTFLRGMREMEQKVTDDKFKNAIKAHIGQTETQVENLHKVFQVLGKEPMEVACPTAEALVMTYQSNVKDIKGKDQLNIATAAAASQVEGFEIGAYRSLVGAAQKLGQNEVVDLLRKNLQQEEQQATKVESVLREMR